MGQAGLEPFGQWTMKEVIFPSIQYQSVAIAMNIIVNKMRLKVYLIIFWLKLICYVIHCKICIP